MRRAFARSAAAQVLGFVLALAAAQALALPLAAGAAGPAAVAPAIAAADAAGHAGEQAKVCGLVAGSKYAERSRGKPTFLDFEKPHPAEVFKVVIWGDDRGKFQPPPETTYLQKQVCVTGRIQLYRGAPEIVVRSPAQLTLGDRARPHG